VPWLEWFAFKHTQLVHIPIAAAVLLPVAVLASQRPGRGIRPWWLVSRFLAWSCFLVMLLTVLSGVAVAREQGILAPGELFHKGGAGEAGLFRLHQIAAGSSILLGLITLRMFHRRRSDYQSLGFLALLFSVLWCGSILFASHLGSKLSRPVRTVVLKAPEETPLPVTVRRSADPEEKHPVRVMDFRSLEPIQVEYVKTVVHGTRWIRTWVTPGSVEAYRSGQPLSPGTIAVLSTQEDKWGRPGPEPGPLYGMEILPDGHPGFVFYWSRVPEARRAEVGGLERVYWRGDDPNLKACLTCHANGMAPAKDRSKLFAFRKKVETVPAGD
jgi:hypothetical protein